MSLDYENYFFNKLCWSIICTYTVSIYMVPEYVYLAWMNGYSTVLHNTASDKYIAIKVE